MADDDVVGHSLTKPGLIALKGRFDIQAVHLLDLDQILCARVDCFPRRTCVSENARRQDERSYARTSALGAVTAPPSAEN